MGSKDVAKGTKIGRNVILLYPPHKEKDLNHRLKYFKVCPEADKPALLDAFKK